MTDRGTLIMRNGPATSRRAKERLLEQTRQYHSPSIAPFAIDLEDLEEPARNSDAFGSVRHTSQFDYARSTTNASFWSGLFAGLAMLGVGATVAFAAFTAEPSYAGAPRSPHVVGHIASSLGVESPEDAEIKVAPKKKVHHHLRRVVEEAAPPSPEARESE